MTQKTQGQANQQTNKRGNHHQIPKWPINVVSIKEATGSATKASVAGNAMRSISDPSASILNKSLHVIFHHIHQKT